MAAVREQLTAVELLSCGAAAGATGKTLLAPVDRVKLMYMTSSRRSFSISEAAATARGITQTAGLRGLWAGNGAAMMRVVPYSALTFTTFDCFERGLLRSFGGERGVLSRLSAGAAAGATATLVTYPLDLLRTRMAAHWTAKSKYDGGAVAAVRDIVRAEGVAALWSGLGPTLVGVIPYAGLSFCTYETLKAAVKTVYPEADGPNGQPLVMRLGVGGVAGLIAQTATYPLHVVRRRMQVQGAGLNKSVFNYDGIFSALRRIYLEEGLSKGLFKGLTLTWIKGPFSVAIAFMINDRLKGALGGWWAEQPEKAAERRRQIGVDDGLDYSPRMDDGMDFSPRIKLTALEALTAGGIAGAVAKTTIAPADRVKILYQVTPERPFSMSKAWGTGLQIARASGVRGLYRGNGAMMIRVVPYSGTAYYTFDLYEAVLLRVLGKEQGGLGLGIRSFFGIEKGSTFDPVRMSGVTSRFLAGAAAGAT